MNPRHADRALILAAWYYVPVLALAGARELWGKVANR